MKILQKDLCLVYPPCHPNEVLFQMGNASFHRYTAVPKCNMTRIQKYLLDARKVQKRIHTGIKRTHLNIQRTLKKAMFSTRASVGTSMAWNISTPFTASTIASVEGVVTMTAPDKFSC